MGGAELRGSYENYYYDISYLLFVTDRRAAKYPFSSHSCMQGDADAFGFSVPVNNRYLVIRFLM